MHSFTGGIYELTGGTCYRSPWVLAVSPRQVAVVISPVMLSSLLLETAFCTCVAGGQRR